MISFYLYEFTIAMIDITIWIMMNEIPMPHLAIPTDSVWKIMYCNLNM
jgi:hypothetical protein